MYDHTCIFTNVFFVFEWGDALARQHHDIVLLFDCEQCSSGCATMARLEYLLGLVVSQSISCSMVPMGQPRCSAARAPPSMQGPGTRSLSFFKKKVVLEHVKSSSNKLGPC